MAIYIVDQFSLNSDLPIDIRYIPDGGSYNDVSAYWYPGMQVYQSIDQKIWYADNSLVWHPISEGADASISQLYQIIADLSTYTKSQINIINSSIWGIDNSINNIYNLITILDASIISLENWNNSQDSSIIDLRNRANSIDSSIINMKLGISDASTRIYNLEVSTGILNNTLISHDSSIVNLRSDISDINASLGDYVRKAGDTMSGPLTINSGGLVLNSDASLFGDLYVDKNATIKGDLIINGSLYVVSVGTLDVSTGFVRLNTGIVGPPTASLQSGIVIERGSAEPYVFLYDETTQSFRIGIASETSTGYLDSSTQAVATRQDFPILNGVAVWNNTSNRFDTYSELSFDLNGLKIDSSLILPKYAGSQNLTLVVSPDGTVKAVPTHDTSINQLYNQNLQQDASIIRIDSSINALFERVDTSVLGAINIGDGSAAIYAGITNDGSLQFRELVGIGALKVLENGNLIEISVDASFGGEVNTASNILGGDASIFNRKISQDLQFKSIISKDPSELIITSDASFVYFDVSIKVISSLAGLIDVSLNPPLKTHQIIEYDASLTNWKNTNNIFWDISLGTTSSDVNGIPQGTNLNELTLKQILFKILYAYQKPTLSIGFNPISGIFERGITSTQFLPIDISYYSTNNNYPLALLNNVHISKTSAGVLYDASLGLVPIASGSYSDTAGINNWGGVNRTISYNVTIDDDQSDKVQPVVGASGSFTFYYRQYWGEVSGITTPGTLSSPLIKALDSSRLAGETNLAAVFNYSSGNKIKYLFAYPDTITTPDNFGILSQILDQNDFDITNSWDTGNIDISVGISNIRYRYYLLKNKVDTSTFGVTFKF